MPCTSSRHLRAPDTSLMCMQMQAVPEKCIFCSFKGLVIRSSETRDFEWGLFLRRGPLHDAAVGGGGDQRLAALGPAHYPGPRKPWNLQLGFRAFDVAHCVTRPSVEVETSASPRSGPRVTQRTRHAGSSCPPLPLPADITGAACMQLRISGHAQP